MPTVHHVYDAYMANDTESLNHMAYDETASDAVAVAAIQSLCALKAREDGEIAVAQQYEKSLDKAWTAAGI